MAKLKYDLSNVEDMPELEHAPVGTYRAKVITAEPKTSSNGNQMIEVRFHLTHDASGKKLKAEYSDIWEYPILDHDHPFVQNKLKNFLTAFGLKVKGTLDTDKIVGQSVQVKLKSDTDDDGEYRPRIGKFMPLTVADEEPEEEPEGDDAEGEDDEDAVDLDQLSRAELKKLIKDEELDITVKKSMTDEQLREAIAEAMSEDEDDDEAEDADDESDDEEDGEEEAEDDEEEDDDSIDLDALDRSELKALIKEQGLEVKVLKKDDDDALRAKIAEAMGSGDEEAEDDEEEDDDEKSTDYSSWAVSDLKKELKTRELASSGSKAVLIKRLQKDDGDEPF
jgi:hypothetical protein